MKSHVGSWILLSTAVAAILLSSFGNAQERGKEQLPVAAEHAKMRAQAETLRLPLAKENELHAEGNLVGFRSTEALFSQRRDSRTYFIQDVRPGQEKEEKIFQGSDKEYTERLNEVFRALEIPAAEISQPMVLQEQTQEGHIDHASGKLVKEEPRPGKRWVTATRHVEGLPVFSSRALMALSSDGRVGFLELHWPVIPAETIQEGHRLEEKIRSKWRPPELEGAHVESVEAGILHSPAVSFVMDIHPVIRVTYAPNAKGLGKKAVRYVDLNGRDVPPPRQFAEPLPAAPEKQRPRSEVKPEVVKPEVVRPR